MAIIKAVNSRASIGHAIKYITKKEKTEEHLIGGYNCNPQTAIDDMKATKKAWDKTSGRQYKHFIQSFAANEEITLDEANQIARQLIESSPLFIGFEVCYATHKDKEHIHTHIIVNSVNYETGHKFNYSNKQLQDFKDLSDEILILNNKSICHKNNEITNFKMNAYKPIEKAAKSNYNSWVYQIMLAVDKFMKLSINKTDFIMKMKSVGIETQWQDNKKYIVFSDESSNKIRDKKLTQTFKIDISKEALLSEFQRNIEQSTSQRGNEAVHTGKSECGFINPRECRIKTTIGDLRQRFKEVSKHTGYCDNIESTADGGVSKRSVPRYYIKDRRIRQHQSDFAEQYQYEYGEIEL